MPYSPEERARRQQKILPAGLKGPELSDWEATMTPEFTEHVVKGGGGIILYVREWGLRPRSRSSCCMAGRNASSAGCCSIRANSRANFGSLPSTTVAMGSPKSH